MWSEGLIRKFRWLYTHVKLIIIRLLTINDKFSAESWSSHSYPHKWSATVRLRPHLCLIRSITASLHVVLHRNISNVSYKQDEVRSRTLYDATPVCNWSAIAWCSNGPVCQVFKDRNGLHDIVRWIGMSLSAIFPGVVEMEVLCSFLYIRTARLFDRPINPWFYEYQSVWRAWSTSTQISSQPIKLKWLINNLRLLNVGIGIISVNL